MREIERQTDRQTDRQRQSPTHIIIPFPPCGTAVFCLHDQLVGLELGVLPTRAIPLLTSAR